MQALKPRTEPESNAQAILTQSVLWQHTNKRTNNANSYIKVVKEAVNSLNYHASENPNLVRYLSGEAWGIRHRGMI